MDSITSLEFGIENRNLYVGTLKGFIHQFELPSPKEVENEYEPGEDGRPPNAKRVGEPIIVEDKKDYDYSISLM